MSEFKLREMPDLQGKGKKKVYPKLTNMGRMSYQEVVEWMESNCHVSTSSVRGVVSALAQTIAQLTARGHSVKIEGLGTFRARLGFAPDIEPEQVEAPNKLNGEHFCVTGMNFRPDKLLLSETTMRAHLTRSRNTTRIKEVKSTPEQRLAQLKAYLSEHGMARVADYWKMTDLTRTSATKELYAFAQDPTTGITTEGKSSHKVYVLK